MRQSSFSTCRIKVLLAVFVHRAVKSKNPINLLIKKQNMGEYLNRDNLSAQMLCKKTLKISKFFEINCNILLSEESTLCRVTW